MRLTNTEHLRQLISSNTDDCVLWDRGRAGRYGAIRGNVRAHRLACSWAHGAPPVGSHAAHSCGAPLCVNPRHLRWASPAENIADKAAHGTNLKGERHNMAKLTSDQASAVHSAAGSLSTIAATFGISKSQAHRIRTGENWGVA